MFKVQSEHSVSASLEHRADDADQECAAEPLASCCFDRQRMRPVYAEGMTHIVGAYYASLVPCPGVRREPRPYERVRLVVDLGHSRRSDAVYVLDLDGQLVGKLDPAVVPEFGLYGGGWEHFRLDARVCGPDDRHNVYVVEHGRPLIRIECCVTSVEPDSEPDWGAKFPPG